MNVTDIKVRYSRKIQPAEYSPIEAEVILTAQLSDGDDAKAAATTLITDAKAAVFVALGVKAKGNEAYGVETTKPTETKPAPAATAEEPKKGPGRPPKQTLTPPAPKAAPAPTADIVDPTDETPAAKPAPKAAPAPAPAEEEDEFASMEAAATVMSAKELQDWIAAQVQQKRITPPQVKEIYAKYGVARSIDTTDEQRPLIKADVEAVLTKR